MEQKKTEKVTADQERASGILWLKSCWEWFSPERIQAIGTAVIAAVTLWTLVFTPLGERLVSEINQTVRETQAELEHHRTVAGKVTLRALWKAADDRLVENEYFARIAADYQTHLTWIGKGEERARQLEELQAKVVAGQVDIGTLEKLEKIPWPLPSNWWLRLPYREGRQSFSVPIHEKSRWGERVAEIINLQSKLYNEPEKDGYAAYKELRRKLELLFDTHVQGGGHGAPRTGAVLIEELKKDETVVQLGAVGAEALRETFDSFLREQPELASTTIRVKFEGPYSERELIEQGTEIVENVTRFRGEFMSFVRMECGPYF